MQPDRPDVFSSGFREDPYPVYAALRRERPVYEEPRYGAFLLTRFDDVLGALLDPGTFSSAHGPGPRPSPAMSQAAALPATDPPHHDRLRALVNRAFTPRRVSESAPKIRALARRLVSEIPDGDFDLVPALSVPLPVLVIADMLGVERERLPDFRRWSDAFVGLLENDPTPEALGATAELRDYFHHLADRRRSDPQDDLVSALVHAEIDGRRLSDAELDGFYIVLLVAGNETTTNLVSNQLRILCERPDLWKRLREDRSLVPKAIEETVRFDCPVQNLGRQTTRPVAVAGVELPADARVIVSFGAANRDPAAFEAADEYRPERSERRHVGFGQGVHFCLGAGLARLEGRIALDALLDRFETLEPGDVPPRRMMSTVIRGFESLPLSGVRA
ncbi:MAG: cytochrome P450 [Myxococcota bacterium]